jgi:TrmH family RNA methyltransferase
MNNPINVGAIVRTAEAGGVTGIITTSNTNDPFSPKALRGAMGSAFRLPFWTNALVHRSSGTCAERMTLRPVATAVRSGITYTELDWTSPRALILGPESTGLSTEELAATDEIHHHSQRRPVESLNVSVASGIVIYEAARQRMLEIVAIPDSTGRELVSATIFDPTSNEI